MVWEQRGKSGRYYYRSRRVGAQVVKEYLGHGPEAAEAARQDAAARARRQAARAAVARERARTARAEALLREAEDVADCLVEAVLLAAGFHRPAYKSWRRRRHET